MADIIKFEPKPKVEPSLAGMARCLACQHKWAAVVPVGVVFFECPSCGTHKGTMDQPIEPEGISVFHCNCSSIYFIIRPSGLFCAACFEEAKGF